MISTSGNIKGNEAIGASKAEKRAIEIATASTIPKSTLEETEGGFTLEVPPEVDDGIDDLESFRTDFSGLVDEDKACGENNE